MANEGAGQTEGQIANPTIQQVNGQTYMIYTAANSQAGSDLNLTMANMSLLQVVESTQGNGNIATQYTNPFSLLADSGTDGVVKRTSQGLTALATYSDITALFNSGTCSGLLDSSGNCVPYVTGEQGWVQASTPVFTPPAGSVTSGTTVAVTCTYGTPYALTPGKTPTTASPSDVLSSVGALAITTNTTLYASCRGVQFVPNTASAVYTLSVNPPLYYGNGCDGTTSNVCTVGGSTIGNTSTYLQFVDSFTTGSDISGYAATAIGVYWGATGAAATWGAALYTISGDTATLVTNGSSVGTTLVLTPGWQQTPLTGCTLAANTTYYIVAQSSSNANAPQTSGGGGSVFYANPYGSFPSTVTGLDMAYFVSIGNKYVYVQPN
jgi:hypothetical protein